MAAPARGYHLEFTPPDAAAAQYLAALLHDEGVIPKRRSRAGREVLYFKDADAIARVLAAMGAGATLLRFENVRALKETKNRVRRLVNTEAANVDRTTAAAATQREAIALLRDVSGLSHLAAPLRRAAELRLAHPTETLAELGRRCEPAVTKSTLGARIVATCPARRGSAGIERRVVSRHHRARWHAWTAHVDRKRAPAQATGNGHSRRLF